jgi:hypothetical protein
MAGSVRDDDPSQAMMDTPANRAPVVVLADVPVAGGVALLAVGLSREYRQKRRKCARPAMATAWTRNSSPGISGNCGARTKAFNSPGIQGAPRHRGRSVHRPMPRPGSLFWMEFKLMQKISDARVRGRRTHSPVETRTPDGKIRISCADANCVGWDPWPCESLSEAQFWYDRHISQSLIYHL